MGLSGRNCIVEVVDVKGLLLILRFSITINAQLAICRTGRRKQEL